MRITQNSRNSRKFVPQNFITLKYKISLKNTETGRERTASCQDSQIEYLIISSLTVSSTMSFFDQISFQSYYMHHITGNYLLLSWALINSSIFYFLCWRFSLLLNTMLSILDKTTKLLVLTALRLQQWQHFKIYPTTKFIRTLEQHALMFASR